MSKDTLEGTVNAKQTCLFWSFFVMKIGLSLTLLQIATKKSSFDNVLLFHLCRL